VVGAPEFAGCGRLHLAADDVLVEEEVRQPLLRRAWRRRTAEVGGPQLIGELLAVHAGGVELGLEDIGRPPVDRQGPVDAAAPAIGGVVALAAEDARELVEEHTALGVELGLDALAEELARQLDLAGAVGVVDDLAEHVAGCVVLRVRVTRAAVDVDLVAPAACRHDKGLDRPDPACAGHRRIDAAVEAVEAALERDVPILLDEVQVVAGVLGDEGDHAAQRIAAVERGRRPAHDLDALQALVVDEVAGIGAGADVGAGEIRDLDAVDLEPNPVLADAADDEVGGPGTSGLVADGEARLVAHELARIVDVLPRHLGRRLHGHGAR
jgi:hypothetical protein